MYINITDNAIDSLNSALKYYNCFLDVEDNFSIENFDRNQFTNLKMTLVMTHNAIELFMKKVLSDINDLLIYSDLSDIDLLTKYSYKIKTSSKRNLVDMVLGESSKTKTISYEALSTRFGIIFDLPNEDKSSLHFLGVYRNKVMHLGIDMVLEYYKIIVAINGALKIIRNTIFDKISVPKDDTEIILELYHFIGEILEIALDYEEDIWASKYSDDFITLNNYLDSILINKDFQEFISLKGYKLSIIRRDIDSSRINLDFENEVEDLSIGIQLYNNPYYEVSIFMDEQGPVYFVWDHLIYSLDNMDNKSFYKYKSPRYFLDGESEDQEFWKEDKKNKDYNLVEFNYDNFLEGLKGVINWTIDNHS